MNYAKLFAFPTWAFTCIALRFHLLGNGHPWYGRTFTLDSWHAAQTRLCRQFDLIFWYILSCS
jgi:hypothetical protein